MLSEEDIKQIRAFIRRYLKAIYCFTDSKFEDIGAFSDGNSLEIFGAVNGKFTICNGYKNYESILWFRPLTVFEPIRLKIWAAGEYVNISSTLLKLEEIFIDEFKKAKNNRQKLLLMTSLPIFAISIDFIEKYLLRFPCED